MKIGSLFDGSGGFPLAGAMCEMEPVWASEIEPYPIRVTSERFPGMRHLGDITKIHGGEIEPVDIITFGSPCQDLSVAGKRAGIHEGARSSLFFHAIRIIREMREATNGAYPRVIVWENVHGAVPMAAMFMGGQGDKAGGIAYSKDVSPTLRAAASGSNQIPDVVYAAGFADGLGERAQGGMEYTEGMSPTLRAGDVRAVVYDCRGNGSGRVVGSLTGDHESKGTDYTTDVVSQKVTGTLCANSHSGSYTGQDAFNDMLPVVKSDKPKRKYIIRRLTPLECCRLQGFPDWWEDGVQGSDAARYRMWGNGIALPCAYDVMNKVRKMLEEEA